MKHMNGADMCSQRVRPNGDCRRDVNCFRVKSHAWCPSLFHYIAFDRGIPKVPFITWEARNVPTYSRYLALPCSLLKLKVPGLRNG